MELVVHEVYEVFPTAASDEELDSRPSRTIARARVPKPKKRRKAAAAAEALVEAAAAAGGEQEPRPPVQLHLFAQSRRCWVPAELVARAPAFFAGREAAEPLRLCSTPQVLSEETPFVTAESIMECLEAASSDHKAACSGRQAELPESMGWLRILRIFAAARLMGFREVADAARARLLQLLGPKSLRAMLAAALAWDDSELLRACYWVLMDMLCRSPPSSPPKKFGIFPDHFGYQKRHWPLQALAPAAEAAARRRAEAQACPVQDGFVVCRVQRAGYEAVLLRETATGPPVELLRAGLGASSAVLSVADEGAAPAPAQHSMGSSRQYCEGCCGVLEASRLGHRFDLHEGVVELLPGRESEQVDIIRREFPYTARRRLGTASWDMDLLAAGRGQSHWRLTLEAPGLPTLSGRTVEGGGGVELAPPGCERETPWLMLGPAEGGSGQGGGGRTLCWRHPIGSALAFAAALAAVYPWDPGGPPT